jgi:glucokinase
MTSYAGLDLGATRIRAVVGTGDRSILGTDRRSTPATDDGTDVTAAVLDCLQAACGVAGVAPGDLRAVGVGTIGPLDLSRGDVVQPSNLPDAVGRIRLEEPIQSLAGDARVEIQNDTVAGVIGELAARRDPPENLVYLSVSSGIGAGVCVDGHVLRGRDGNAGEVGHVTVDPSGAMTCGCGGAGHWEAYCSGDNIPRYARLLQERHGYATGLDLGSATAADVFAADDELARRVLDRVADWNTLGFGTVIDAFAPREIVVGGAVALENPDGVLGPVRERIDGRVAADVPRIRTTDLGASVVVRGALASVTPGIDSAERHRPDHS